jgi:RNA polymerase sigma-70 factor (ECF subfamily)
MQNLIERIKSRDRKAQEILYKKYANRFFYSCYRYTGNELDAGEVINIAFYKIFKNIGSLVFINEKAFEGWMYKILINETLIFLRQSKMDFLNIEIAKEEPVNLNISEHQLSEQDCHAILQKLPTGYRTVFNLYAIEGYSHQEIGEMLDISESTSRSQLSRARELLKTFIHKEF